MRRAVLCLLSALAVVLTAAPAEAKGPTDALLTGPGIDQPIDLRQEVEGMTFWDLADRLSYSVTFDGHPPSPPVLENPNRDLGPAYPLRWSGPGPGEDFAVTVVLYPWADDGARLYVPPGQTTLSGSPTEEFWLPLRPDAVNALRKVGLPPRDVAFAALPGSTSIDPTPASALQPLSADGGSSSWPVGVMTAAVVLGAASLACVAVVVHRHRRPEAAPAC
jgi:hypothetical protein